MAQNCTKETCPLSMSYYDYVPSLPANAVFLALFATSGLIHFAQGIVHRAVTSPWSYTLPIVLGCIGEVLGYLGRVLEHSDPFDLSAFIMQSTCLTFCPAFFTASIYFCLGDFVRLYDPDMRVSRFKDRRTYAWIFIPCDIASILLQAAGGGLAASKQKNSQNTGVDIMIAALVFQVVTLLAFIILSLEFVYRIRKYRNGKTNYAPVSPSLDSFGESKYEPDSANKTVYGPDVPRKTFFAYAIPYSAAVLLIFARCCYRVAELSKGWRGPLNNNQTLFIVFESVFVVIATFCLNLSNPIKIKRLILENNNA